MFEKIRQKTSQFLPALSVIIMGTTWTDLTDWFDTFYVEHPFYTIAIFATFTFVGIIILMKLLNFNPFRE